MKVLLIGGTGTISSYITVQLWATGHDVFLVNRGNKSKFIQELCKKYYTTQKRGTITELIANCYDKEELQKVAYSVLKNGEKFDVVADFIAYNTDHIEKDIDIFRNITHQYLFISSASAYQTPLSDFRITEGTPLSNPLWEYSRNKIACEDLLLKAYREEGFPITIVRPSHTYDERSVPLGVHGHNGSWQVIKRIKEEKPVIIHGDGTSLWTMTHSEDFAKGFCCLLGNIHAIGETVHITSDESLTWNQIYESIAKSLGVKLKAVHISSEFLASSSNYDFTGSLLGDKANSVYFNNAKLKLLVPDFCATIRFDQGVKRVLDYLLAHLELQKDDPDFDAWCDAVIDAINSAKEKVKNNFCL